MERIAEGRTAEIFAWDDEHILKLYRPGWAESNAEHEFTIAKAVEQAGIAAPRALRRITHEDRFGILYERIAGRTMGATISRQPYRIRAFAVQMAALHAQMHRPACADLPPLRPRLIDRITHHSRLESATVEKLLAHLETLPDESRICHGDFHPENIMLNPQHAVIIDWNDATCGTPAADVARTQLILWIEEKKQNWFVRWFIQDMRKTYLRHYAHLTGISPADVLTWMPIIAAARLAENVPDEHEHLMEWINR